MKYLTKEWYSTMQKTSLHSSMRASIKAESFDEQYYRNLYKRELKKYLKFEKEMFELIKEDPYDEYNWDNIEPYDVEKLKNQFKQRQAYNIAHLNKSLPQNILKDVADIRVLALDKVSKSIKKKIEKYCKENEKTANKVMDEYYHYYESIENSIPEKISTNYGFHDCQIISIKNIGDDIIFELDNSGGFTEIQKVKFVNANMIECNLVENSHWLYQEIYKQEEYYEFHIGVNSDNDYGYDYITIKAVDICFE